MIPLVNEIEFYCDGDWYPSNLISNHCSIGEFNYDSDEKMGVVMESGLSFDLIFTLDNIDTADMVTNRISDYMSNLTAIKINNCAIRCTATISSIVSYSNSVGYVPDITYTISSKDTLFYRLEKEQLSTDQESKKIRNKLGATTFLSEVLPVSGPAKWRLNINGNPNSITIQAVKMGSIRKVYGFQAIEMKIESGFNTVVVDNVSKDFYGSKQFYAKKSSGEMVDLSEYISVKNSGFFDLMAGDYTIQVFITGSYSNSILEIYKGVRIPYAKRIEEVSYGR